MQDRSSFISDFLKLESADGIERVLTKSQP